MTIKVILELSQFRLQICRRPEQGLVQEFTPHRTDHALHERMRKRHVGNRLDFRYLKDVKIGLPLMESIQRIVIRTEVFGQTAPADRLLKHPAQPRAVNDATLDAKANEATGKLVHHDQHPMGCQGGRFTAE